MSETQLTPNGSGGNRFNRFLGRRSPSPATANDGQTSPAPPTFVSDFMLAQTPGPALKRSASAIQPSTRRSPDFIARRAEENGVRSNGVLGALQAREASMRASTSRQTLDDPSEREEVRSATTHLTLSRIRRQRPLTPTRRDRNSALAWPQATLSTLRSRLACPSRTGRQQLAPRSEQASASHRSAFARHSG